MKHIRRLMGALLIAAPIAAPLATSVTHRELCRGFLPENDLRIEADAKLAGGINEAQFNRVLDRIAAQYTSEFADAGRTLKIARNWKDATVNAYASQNGDTWTIAMYGGLARYSSITEDGFAMVACHEIGHHIGGAPKYRSTGDDDSQWASNEGEADYSASLKCLRRLWENDDNESIVSAGELSAAAKQACATMHRSRAGELLCLRNSQAAMSVARLFQELGKEPAIKFETPDARKVSRTEDAHPRAQCRLDTYFQGALCTRPVSEELSMDDYRPGSCWNARTDEKGLRPRCWFKP